MKTFNFSLFSAFLLLLSYSSFAQTPAPCEEPYPQVQNLSVSVDEVEENITLTWTPIIGSLGCRIQVRQEGTIPWLTRTIVQPDLDSTSISGAFLVYQSNYDARVACGCSANPLIIGDFSEIVSFNTGTAGQQVPCENPYPAVLNPSAAPNAEGNAFVLSWDPIPQSAGCQIEYSLLEGGTLNAAQVLESELSSFSIPETDLIPNQDYQWRVRCGCSLSPVVVGPWMAFQEFNSGNIGVDCPDLGGNIGDACDDGNAATVDDAINENCECLGADPCGELPPGTVCNPITGRFWMDRNLGASQVATSPTDAASYGDLYQWGRGADGHQIRTSATTPVLSNNDQPPHGDFIQGFESPFDWRSPQNDNLWQGVDGINNPCPEGFRIPTEEEWLEERLTWNTFNTNGGFNSSLKLPAGGYRSIGGGLTSFGTQTYYWSSSVSGTEASTLVVNGSGAGITPFPRAGGICVRCIKEYDCPNFQGNVGDPCDDGNPATSNDSVTETCECLGSFECPLLEANIGDACDDENPNTVNDVVTETCECLGTDATPLPVLNPATGRVWLDRNLGAAQVATSPTDSLAYGDLYQWGRGADGHQKRNSPTTTTLSSTDQPENDNFILEPGFPFDWRSPQNNDLWQGVNGVNNPCPAGYRLPTQEEWEEERLSWSSNDAAGAFASPLKITSAGFRFFDGEVVFVGELGRYWTSTPTFPEARSLSFDGSSALTISTGSRVLGFCVRCIQD